MFICVQKIRFSGSPHHIRGQPFPFFSKNFVTLAPPWETKNYASKKETSLRKNKISEPSGSRDENFFSLVYEVARQIPKGRVTSYGAIAACLGTKSSARMVGWAMNGCHRVRPKVPAHRVVNRNGMLTGKHHFSPPGLMEQLLKKEGINVKNDQVVNFKTLFWDPVQELGL